ncbi:MAG: mechanosensitive ion channel family protein [Candidatus Thermoplasmatota archaeon]|nr:mechanosensitive ion channel family protein [Candidatus Thermoplasmatota archaeon]
MDLSSTLPYLDVRIFDLIVSALILVIGFFLVKLVVYSFKKSLKKSKLPSLVIEFLGRFLSAIFYVVVLLIAISFVGVNVGSVVLGFSAVLGLILGFGLQDTMNNVFSGVWIAALRPLDIDERVEVQGQDGIVTSVGLMATELLKPDNTRITIPNKLIWDEPIINYSRMSERRIDIPVGISYDGNVDKAVKVALEFLENHEDVLDQPEPQVSVTDLGDSSVNLMLKGWTDREKYWQVRFELTKGIFKAYNEADIEIPFPQRDIHIDGDMVSKNE